MANPYEPPAAPPRLKPDRSTPPLWQWIAVAIILLPAVVSVGAVLAYIACALLMAWAFWDF